jgi:hypothetical protein
MSEILGKQLGYDCLEPFLAGDLGRRVRNRYQLATGAADLRLRANGVLTRSGA